MTLTLGSSAKAIDSGENQLVEAARSGDDRAFEQLYARYRQRIFAFILSRVHDHGRAEDIAQEVFISALRRLRGSEGRITFKPWIYEIAKNACIDEYRRGSRSREVPLETDGQLITDRYATLRTAPPPAVAIEGKQRLDDLRGAFGGLSSSHHRLLVMREFEGLSYDEIGTQLGMTRPMVESSLFRARRKLTEEYEELASGRRCEQVQDAISSGRLRCAEDLGLRDRRRFARHLSHCQPCRHLALVEGVDNALVQPRRGIEKIAAILPFPLLRRLVAGRPSGTQELSAALGGRAAAVIVAAALAGAGGGIVQSLHGGGAPAHSPTTNMRLTSEAAAPGASGPAVSTHWPIIPHRFAASPGRDAGVSSHHHVRLASLTMSGDRGGRSAVRRHPAGAARHVGSGGPPTHPSSVATSPSSASTASSTNGASGLTSHLPSLSATINRTLSAVTAPLSSGGATNPLGSLINSVPVKSAVGTVTGLAATLGTSAGTVLGAVANSATSSGQSGSTSAAAGPVGPGAAGSSAGAGASGVAGSAAGVVSRAAGAVASLTDH